MTAACWLSALLLLVTVVDGLQPSRPHQAFAGGARRPARAAAARLQEGFLKDLASKALSELERQASLAAMQEQPEPDVDVGLPPARTLPDSFEDAIVTAVDAVAECAADGATKMVVEFDTSAGDETYNLQSRTLKFIQPFLLPFVDAVAPDFDEPPPAAEAAAAGGAEEARPPRLQLLFPDEGTAAYVRQNWAATLPSRTQLGSMPRAKLAVGAEVLLLVAPQATEVPAVQRLLAQVEEEAPTTLVLLANPKLVDMQSTGYGLVGRELRDMVSNSFNVAFALKSYVTGAVYRVHPGGWSVWREAAAAPGGYELTYSSSRRPAGEQVDELLAGEEEEADGGGGSMLDGLGAFIKGFQAM